MSNANFSALEIYVWWFEQITTQRPELHLPI